MLIKMKCLTCEEQNLKLMSCAKRYNRWIFSNLSPFIGKKVLEIGGGVGSMTSFMLDRDLVVSTDVSDYNIGILRSRFGKNKRFFAVKTDISKKNKDLAGFSFDTVVCLNVLEHIKDDVIAIKNAAKLLDKGGRLVLLLPSSGILYGTVDCADHHFRRYDRKATIQKVEKAGFRVSKSFYMNMPGFFGWYYDGRILKKKVHSTGSISLFDRLVPVFSFFEGLIRPPFGLSLIIIAEKK